ncbi:MAG: PilZ domain-containing protein [Myxococcota bacterium]
MERPPAPVAPRRAPRIPRRVERLCTGAQRPRFLGYLANVSETGAFIQCSCPRAEGTRLDLRVHLGREPDALVHVGGRVIWTRRYAGRNQPSAGMGIEFETPGGRDLERLRAFLRDESARRTLSAPAPVPAR